MSPAAGGGGDADADAGAAMAYAEFRRLVESADRKFARVRDLPSGCGGADASADALFYRKAFKAYTAIWRFQQERRRELVSGGLRRWEIGEVASRIGQLYYGQYLRTSESRFLVGAYVFYEAILQRGYFDAAVAGRDSERAGKLNLPVRYKELRFFARFLVVALLLNREKAVTTLAERFGGLVEELRAAYPSTNFKDWKLVVQEIWKFLKAEKIFKNSRPLRYNVLYDSYPSYLQHIGKFHKGRVLKLTNVVLTSYHRNEVKFTELTLDTFRMVQCLEYEPTIAYQSPDKEAPENGIINDDRTGPSGRIDVNIVSEMEDQNLPSNPQKAIVYHPSVPHLIMVIAKICAELLPESVLLIYISAAGSSDHNAATFASQRQLYPPNQHLRNHFGNSHNSGSYLWLGPRGCGGSANLYPEDLIPFTRSPLFLVIDSQNSLAFKAIHGAEKGEPAAMLLSPQRETLLHSDDPTSRGSQFTYFLTAPLQAFCQIVGLSSDLDDEAYSDAEHIVSSALAEWEENLCSSNDLDRAWAQILPDPFLRRMITRFLFCRAVLYFYHPQDDHNEHLPACLPALPDSVHPDSGFMNRRVRMLAEKLGVIDCFHFLDSGAG